MLSEMFSKARTIAIVIVAGGGLAACSSLPDYANPVSWYEDTTDYLFGSDETAATPSGEDEAFPNLSDVPDRPEGTPEETRRELREGLIADRDNARYTDETVADPALTGARAGGAVAAAPQTTAEAAPEPETTSETAAGTAANAERLTAAEPRPVPRARDSGSRTLVDRRERGESFLEKLGTGAPNLSASNRTLRERQRTSETRASASRELTDPTPAPSPSTDTEESVASVPRRAPEPPTRSGADLETGTAGSRSFDAGTNQSGVVVIGGGGAVADLDATPASQGVGVSLHAATVYFDHSSAQLSADDRRVLEGVRQLQSETGGIVRVVGHASSRTRNLAPDRQQVANLRVSQKRADAVANALIRAGVPVERILVAARGDHEPVFYESMPVGEAGNRRAEIYLDY